MELKYQKIFEPHVMKNGVVLKNRVIYPNAQQTAVNGVPQYPTEQMIDDMIEFGYAGASLMNVAQIDKLGGGAAPRKHATDPNEKDFSTHFDYDDEKVWCGLQQQAAASHLYHTKLLARIAPVFGFPAGYTYAGGDVGSLFPPVDDPRLKRADNGAMNDWKQKRGSLTLEEMKKRCATKEMIQDVIKEMVKLCVKYKRAGWDGISVRADRYIDAATNVRDDEYGGEIENRGRFQLELYQAIKEACGDRFIIQIALMGNSPYGHDALIPHGYTTDEFIRFCKLVEPYVDMVEVREQSGVGYQNCGYNSRPGVHPCLEWAKQLRESGFKGTIAVNGGFGDPDEMEAILKEGYVDVISIGRSLRAEPRLIQKLRTEGEEAPVPCIRCNKCHTHPNGVGRCAVNPKNALANHMPVIDKGTKKSKKVAVIGGGPIGMRTACMAAERGHNVTLFEKSDRLGGKTAYYAPLYPQQWPIDQYRAWCIDELGRRGDKVVLNCAPEPDYLKEQGFEAVIACTGSAEKRPPVEGADSSGVWSNEDVYMQKANIGNKVVLVGGGTVSTETAMYLASIGKDVTILTRGKVLMPREARPHGPHTMFEYIVPEKGYGGVGAAWYIYDNLKPVFEATTIKVTPTSVTYKDKDGNEHTIECDSVVVSGGYKPLTEEALRYSTCTPQFYLAGDCDPDTDKSELMYGNIQAYGAVLML